MDPELVQVAEIAWGADRQLVAAEGACSLLFGAPDKDLIGRALEEVLGVSPQLGRELDQKARSRDPGVEFVASSHPAARTLRLVLGIRDGQPRAGVLSLSSILVGAPPLQIAKIASSLSHEIRNPLSSVKMAVQTLAKNDTLGERDKRRLTIANREVRTMERMLSLFSEYGRDASPVLESMLLRNLLLESAALIELEFTERKMQLDIREDGEPLRVRADAARFRPVLAQILLNIGAAQGAGSTVMAQLKKGPHRGATLELEDASFALLPNERAHLFEPFGSRLARGAGLSLAAMQRVMSSFGGAVDAVGNGMPPTLLTLSFPE